MRAWASTIAVLLLVACARTAFADEPAPPLPPPEPVPVDRPAATATETRPANGTAPSRDFQSGGDIGDTLREIRRQRESRFNFGVYDFAQKLEKTVFDATGLKFAAAYTMLYQHATDGGGPRDAFGADFDVLASWDIIGSKTCNPGGIEARFETRYKIATDIPPAKLSTTIDSLWPTVSGFNEQPASLTQIYWRQKLLCGRLDFRIGKLSAYSSFFGNRFNDSALFFINYAFADSPAVFFPGNGAGVHVRYDLSDKWRFVAGIQDANGSKTKLDPSSITLREFWYAFQVEFRPEIRGLGPGTYRIGYWESDARKNAGAPSGAGTGISFDQQISEKVIAFLRYDLQGAGLVSRNRGGGFLTGVRQSFRVGLGVEGPFKFAPDDYFGVAYAWGEPSRDRVKDSDVAELFYRSQLTDTSHMTLGVQRIQSSTIFERVWVWSLRYRFEF